MIRYPNITGKTDAQQLEQMKSYLIQIVGELNFQLSNVGTGSGGGSYPSSVNTAVAPMQKTDPVSTFNDIKALIIKSADIINAYYDEINSRLEGVYVAESDFGIYAEQTANDIEANSKGIEQNYTNTQTIVANMEQIASNMQQLASNVEAVEQYQIDVSANIKHGLLYYDEAGVPVYGLEIGQRTVIDGSEVFNKFARFTSEKLSFYDQNGNEVAYISDRKLYITHIEVIGSYTQGGFVDTTLADGSIVTKWVGGGS